MPGPQGLHPCNVFNVTGYREKYAPKSRNSHGWHILTLECFGYEKVQDFHTAP